MKNRIRNSQNRIRNSDRELMQQALDLLDDINQCSLPPTGIPLPAEIDHVMEALRNRLEKWTAKDMAYRPGGLPDWSAAGFGKPPMRSEQWWRHEVSNAYANGYEKGRASVKQREWQGLTTAERKALWSATKKPSEFAELIEAKLRAKNGFA